MTSSTPTLLPCLARLAQLQNEAVDRLALQEAATAATAGPSQDPQTQLQLVAEHLQTGAPRWLPAPDAAVMPALLCTAQGQWGLLRGKNGQDQWVSEWWDAAANQWGERTDTTLDDHAVATLRLSRPFEATKSPLYQLIRHEVFSCKKLIWEAVLGGLMINVVAIAGSFYSMHVYDRVIPTGALQTLLVLTLGVVMALLFEWVAKRARAHLYEQIVDQVDQRLARRVFMRFLAIRLDQLPHSVGTLAGQMRGYETVRGFFTAITTNFLVDAPFAVVFALVITAVGGVLALVPLACFALSIGVGLWSRGRVEAHARSAMAANNLKSGLLVETVEGAETIKSGQGGWRMLSRWMTHTDEARSNDMQMRNISEHAQHLGGLLQQLSSVLLIAGGALLVSRGELTMGGLLACSILSGRVLAPVAVIPSQLLLWAHTKAALQGLDRLWSLQDDHHGLAQPLTVSKIEGHYRLEGVVAGYHGRKALAVPSLHIRAGEKVGVLGPIGAGKTSLLRLLSGMYKPQEGRILLDDLELAHLAKPVLSEHVGYVQQEGRLFAGTLRDNLVLGLIDPGDEAILQTARQTGLLETVIKPHPKGLQQEIFEGGSGLSGGQRQLVNLTRTFLRRPRVWLLDEPTASMDRQLELHIMRTLQDTLGAQDTLVLVTHKADMLALVDRLIVIANHQIVLDGPKAQVLQKLQAVPASQEGGA